MYLPLKLRHAMLKSATTGNELKRFGIPIARSLPGHYLDGSVMRERSRQQLVNMVHAKAAGSETHGSAQRLEE